MQFKCNFSATRCDIFDLARNLSHLAAIFAIKLDKKRLCHPCIVIFWRAKMVEKTKQTQKSKKACWTVEEEELLVELCQTANVFIKQTVQSLKKWTNGNPPVKILGEDLKQSLKAHLRFHPYLRETKNLSITFALVFMSKFNCNCR